jgi:RimJ/RimL family protein N-acetyltransferase
VARSLLHVGFDTLRLHRIAAWCIADNQRAVRVVQRLGMQLEGRMRENDYFKERWWDTLLFALLEHEWHTASQTRYEQEET